MKPVLTLLLLLLPLAVLAQPAPENGLMYSNEKIYVVVAVVALILAGLLAYLVNLDRRVGRLERQVKR